MFCVEHCSQFFLLKRLFVANMSFYPLPPSMVGAKGGDRVWTKEEHEALLSFRGEFRDCHRCGRKAYMRKKLCNNPACVSAFLFVKLIQCKCVSDIASASSNVVSSCVHIPGVMAWEDLIFEKEVLALWSLDLLQGG